MRVGENFNFVQIELYANIIVMTQLLFQLLLGKQSVGIQLDAFQTQCERTLQKNIATFDHMMKL